MLSFPQGSDQGVISAHVIMMSMALLKELINSIRSHHSVVQVMTENMVIFVCFTEVGYLRSS